MNFVQISNCWFNLQHVESIEVSRTSSADAQELYTVTIGLGSGRIWSRRDIERQVRDDFLSRVELVARQ
jgi:hypothetical protein